MRKRRAVERAHIRTSELEGKIGPYKFVGLLARPRKLLVGGAGGELLKIILGKLKVGIEHRDGAKRIPVDAVVLYLDVLFRLF